jgi:hypothetical protein
MSLKATPFCLILPRLSATLRAVNTGFYRLPQARIDSSNLMTNVNRSRKDGNLDKYSAKKGAGKRLVNRTKKRCSHCSSPVWNTDS